jgi:hypothetical protein
MPWELVRDDRGRLQNLYLVEMRSISGYSGSPVFTLYNYLPPLDIQMRRGRAAYIASDSDAHLLGINCGHSHARGRVFLADGRQNDYLYAEAATGLAMVVPAWKITEALTHAVAVLTSKLSQSKARPD